MNTADKVEAPEEVQQQRDIRTPNTRIMVTRSTAGAPPAWGYRREWAHKQSTSERLVPLVSCDYVYMLPTGVFARDEVSEEERTVAPKVLVADRGATERLCVHAVPRNGADQHGYIVEQFKQDVVWFGQ